jgi:hypothetical protein
MVENFRHISLGTLGKRPQFIGPPFYCHYLVSMTHMESQALHGVVWAFIVLGNI